GTTTGRSIRRRCMPSLNTLTARSSAGPGVSTRPCPGARDVVGNGCARCRISVPGCSITGRSFGCRLDNGSRMTRECHVRFCERPRGKFPRPTHHFGMKVHIGADSRSGLVHSVSVTAANVHDSQELPKLLHGQETRLYGDSAYRGK